MSHFRTIEKYKEHWPSLTTTTVIKMDIDLSPSERNILKAEYNQYFRDYEYLVNNNAMIKSWDQLHHIMSLKDYSVSFPMEFQLPFDSIMFYINKNLSYVITTNDHDNILIGVLTDDKIPWTEADYKKLDKLNTRTCKMTKEVYSSWNRKGNYMAMAIMLDDLRGKLKYNIAETIIWDFCHGNEYEDKIYMSSAQYIYLKYFLEHIYIVFKMVNIINCKNIEIIDKPVAPKLLKKQRKKNKQAKDTYKILRLSGMSKRRKKQRPGQVLNATRLHLCRGHFKTFTEERPLLGHAIGTFWWNAQYRGNAELGKAMKDYEYKGAGK